MNVTIEISEEHAALLRRIDFDGMLPANITSLEDRVQWLVAGLARSLLLDEAELHMIRFKLDRREHHWLGVEPADPE